MIIKTTHNTNKCMKDNKLKISICDDDGMLAWMGREFVKQPDVIIDDNNPDIVFHSCFGKKHVELPAEVKVYVVHENVFPDFNIDDYAISHVRDSIGGRNLFMPLAIKMLHNRIELPPVTRDDANRKFAIFVAFNDWIGTGASLRKEFAELLTTKYKKVDCPGRVLHNIDIPELNDRWGDWVNGKRKVLGRYKFNICFENTNTDGYITEKIVDAFLTNSVPIYWGSEGNLDPFPKDACICANDYPTLEALMERVKEVDMDDDIYLSILSKNPLRQPEFWDVVAGFNARHKDFLNKIFERTLAYKRGELVKPCRGRIGSTAFGVTVAAACQACPILKHKLSIREVMMRGFLHLHFLRPGKKLNKRCPLENIRQQMEY